MATKVRSWTMSERRVRRRRVMMWTTDFFGSESAYWFAHGATGKRRKTYRWDDQQVCVEGTETKFAQS